MTDVKSLFRPALFWDADEIDPERHAAYIIGRVLEYGDWDDVVSLRSLYSDDRIIEVVRRRRCLSPRTGKYWALRLNIPLAEVACLRKFYHPEPSGQLKP